MPYIVPTRAMFLFRFPVFADGEGVEPGVKAAGTFEMPTNPSDGQTVTIGSRVYTFQTVLTNFAGNVKIGASANVSITNLYYSLNPPANGGAPGIDYALATTPHSDVEKVDSFPPATTLNVQAKVVGTAGNSIAVSTNVGGAAWGWSKLTGGIPEGPDSTRGDLIDFLLLEAARTIDTSWEENDYQPAILYLTAHLLATDNSEAGGSVELGGTAGIASESFAGMSISYAANSANSLANNGAYGATEYGRRFLVILYRNRGGPLVV